MLFEVVMKVFIKPNGTEISVSEQSEEFARSLGWKEKGKAKKKATKKKAIKKKATKKKTSKKR